MIIIVHGGHIMLSVIGTYLVARPNLRLFTNPFHFYSHVSLSFPVHEQPTQPPSRSVLGGDSTSTHHINNTGPTAYLGSPQRPHAQILRPFICQKKKNADMTLSYTQERERDTAGGWRTRSADEVPRGTNLDLCRVSNS